MSELPLDPDAGSLVLAEGVELPLEIVTSTLAVLANRGGGKSAFTHRLVELMYTSGLPVVVVDVKGDWWGLRSSADGKGPGLPFVIFGGEHGDVPLEETAGELLADLIVDDRIPAVLDLSHMSKGAAQRFATSFAERLYRRNRDPLMVVVEEADVLIPQRASADTMRLIGAMEDLAKRGRHRGIGLAVVSQRPQEVAKAVLDLMETVVLLRMTGPRSIKAVEQWVGVNADQDGSAAKDIIGSLPTLEVGEGWVWSPGFLRLRVRARFPLFETFDSHATPKPGQIRIVPTTRANVDLERLGREIAATAERARENDPSALRVAVERIRRERDAAINRAETAEAQVVGLGEAVADREQVITDLQRRLEEHQASDRSAETVAALQTAMELIAGAVGSLNEQAPPREVAGGHTPDQSRPPAVVLRAPASDDAGVQAPSKPERPACPPAAGEGSPNGTRPRFRKGAHRMIESLGRMAPLRLTKAQWGMVSGLKHTGGTWSTYLGELRREGLIVEDGAGFTLTDAGWDYLGARPDPMTAAELQQHYLSILRAGAGRMLQACIAAYPGGLSKEQLAEKSGVALSGGTFSTYLGELRRNGLVEQIDGAIAATSILMHGAAGGQR